METREILLKADKVLVVLPGSPMETRGILLKADKVTVTFERLADGKKRVTASSWDDAKVILPYRVLEVRERLINL